MTMLNISCVPLGNSVWLERDLVFPQKLYATVGLIAEGPGSSLFLSIFCFSAPK